MTPSRGTKTLNALGFLNITDTLAQIGLLWASGTLVTPVFYYFLTRSDDLVFFPSFDPFFSLGCLGAGDSLHRAGFL